MGQMKMKCIFKILEKNISVLAKASQVSDVAHGPLVLGDCDVGNITPCKFCMNLIG
jgi:hypothetical protein